MKRNHYIWYAVLNDNEDNDWGTGSTRKREALKMLRQRIRDGYDDAYIAVIDQHDDDPMATICIDEIRI